MDVARHPRVACRRDVPCDPARASVLRPPRASSRKRSPPARGSSRGSWGPWRTPPATTAGSAILNTQATISPIASSRPSTSRSCTPFDRQDIHRLASNLDDVLDAIEAVSDLLVLHRIETPLPAISQQADVLVKITQAVSIEVRHLRALSEVERDWGLVNRLEREGDRIYRRATADLFSGEHPVIEVLKWKDIVDQIEDAIDGCQSISNTIESIALKYA